ncbi:beta-1,4-N-acetylgalactosaminyltransferase 3 isoform X1 [Stegostoma tigrinum]|uniref:beta-1,4-N-acetylgalactosaminyltransferase 3 isoform X1 n=3 Tax=Stegostoma tigrinum TaxID=3053191 RepID=UPI00202B6B29|nr:beta-1,4-N-acetylgalactosaminyltransferase 3 isoform X1 [Stegostoma tigrinum]
MYRMMFLIPIKKIRKHFNVLMFVVIVALGVWAAYLEFVASSEWRRGAFKPHREFRNWKKQPHVQRNKVPGVARDLEYYNQRKEETGNEDLDSKRWQESRELNFAEMWSSKFMGQANLHIFEDWCGDSVDQLRKNIHFPLFPHTRTVVKKLAVAPRWTNYGLRIFGYIHPYADGEFQFALASDDNSEFWLSTDESPSNLTLLARVGKTGKEWTAPGEFGKFQNQVSKPTQLLSFKKYYFEVLHKQNAQGTDHIEVAWRLHNTGLKFDIVDSKHISLYVNESLIKLNEVQHIPQSVASHKKNFGQSSSRRDHPAEMLKYDPRDSFYQLPLIDESHVHKVLPDCVYRPSYIIKGFPLLRYQGLQFVHLTYVYPNDYTRLTHMESENKCFYYENTYSLDRFGFDRYMKMDTPQKPNNEKFQNPFRPAGEGKPNKQMNDKEEELGENADLDEEEYDDDDDQFPQLVVPKAESQKQNQMNIEGFGNKRNQGSNIQQKKYFAKLHDRQQAVTVKDYGDDYDDYAFKRRRKLFYIVDQQPSDNAAIKTVDTRQIEITLADKGMKDRNNELTSSEETMQSTQSLRQKITNISHSSSKKKYSISDHDLERKSANLLVGQKAGVNNTTQNVLKRENLDIDTNISRVLFPESQVPGLRKRPGEMIVQKPKRTIYAQQPLALGQNVIRKNGTFLNKKGIKKSTKFLTGHRELTSPSTLQEGVVHDQNQIEVSNKSIHGQRNKTYNGTKNTGPNFLSKKEVQPNKVEDQMDRIVPSLANVQRQDKGHNYPERKNIAVLWGSRGKIKEKLQGFGKRAEKWRHISSMGTVTNSKQTNEEEDEDEVEEDLNVHQHAYDKAVSWDQTFTVNNMDFNALRSDWIDLRCNVSGNLLMKEQEALDVAEMYLRKLNEKHKGIYTLHQLVSIEKRLDRIHGSRYLLELTLLVNKKTIVRLSEYIYGLNRNGYYMDGDDDRKMRAIFRHRGRQLREKQEKIMLCAPTGFKWQRNAVVHFIVPVKNQARWVQQFIFDMEELYRATGDEYFNVIITDYSSTDMDVEKALKQSMLTRYQYVKLEGNFERSAGLQAGIDVIKDDHSIVFLCDLHISFPPGIIDSIRKHCVEGKMAFAPIVMRLNCGSSPQEPDGYWEINGFGLLGIYKSDLDGIGGMNTKEFRDRWGGEDWELLDRIFQAGLEVERLYMRNFFHFYHSKRGMWNRKQVKTT